MDDLTNVLDDHNRTIIHFDMDYYYAQVEEILNPDLKNKPLGIQQRNSVVTSNYIARKFGIKKMMTIAEAKKLCPQIILVNGEDLTKYKQMSAKIFDILLQYTPLVEKLGLDENYLDVSEIVNKRLNNNDEVNEIIGCIYPPDSSLNYCECGCSKRLKIATHIANDIRKELYETLKITCCAGIAHNKLLAKLVGGMNKPNNQTVLVATETEKFMRELGSVKKITGIGIKTELQLNEINIKTIEDLQNCDLELLKRKFGHEIALKLKELSFGHDNTPVQRTGKPKSIGLEDSCRPISVRKDVEERFRLLLMRLVNQVSEDGRIPITIKVILRKFDSIKKTSHRETRQANISPSLFKYYQNQIILADGAQEKLLKTIMKLFERVVELNKPFNITLLGLAFSKFQERKHGSSSIANFLIKKSDLEVQSVTSLKSDGYTTTTSLLSSSSTTITNSTLVSEPADDYYRRRTIAQSPSSLSLSPSPSPIPMHVDSFEPISSDVSDFSETEIEPSPKKTRLGLLVAKRRCISSNDTNDIASPSKLRVAELRLNSRDSDKDMTNNVATVNFNTTAIANDSQNPSINNSHYNHRQHQKMNINNENHNDSDYDSKNNIHNENSDNDDFSNASMMEQIPTTTITGNLANIPCPSGLDPNVFKELPVEMQNELISSWRNSLAVKANSTNNTNITAATVAATTTGTKTSKNTLHRYFIRNN